MTENTVCPLSPVRGTVRVLQEDGDEPCSDVPDLSSNWSQPGLRTNLVDEQNDNEDKGAADGGHVMTNAHVRRTVRLFQVDGDAYEPCDVSNSSSLPSLGNNPLDERQNSNEDKGAADGDHINITAYEHGDERRRASITSITTTTTAGQTNIAVNDSNKADGKQKEGRVLPGEERAMDALVREFREAAGYDAAYEEFDTTLEYRTVADPDGGTREVLVGAHFAPEPLRITVRRVMKVIMRQLGMALGIAALLVLYTLALWQFACRSLFDLGPAFDVIRRIVACLMVILFYLHITEGVDLHMMLSRLKECRLIFAVLMMLSILIAVAHQAHGKGTWRRRIITPMWWSCMIICPYLYFRQVAGSQVAGSIGIKHKQEYALKGTIVFALSFTSTTLLETIFFPLAAAAHTDKRQLHIAVSFVLMFLPVVSLVNKLIRSIKEGPPTLNSHMIVGPAVIYVVAPKCLQADMVGLDSKLIYST